MLCFVRYLYYLKYWNFYAYYIVNKHLLGYIIHITYYKMSDKNIVLLIFALFIETQSLLFKYVLFVCLKLIRLDLFLNYRIEVFE